ncbi:putative F-box/LRR-repeat protein At5g41840 [Lycium ferocissimum]|uniref:putative F-box/LRR-repeat protein At5g41840 n=1 Tax=Lycium ferocissimum TaxID=112874 RepID=UPI0028164DAE|nr:putative F-box/LRR-repeat protein At5g41840 [Lycium ferocissimum]
MGTATSTTDILPDCLVRKILSYLSFKEAARMSTLSKTWLRVWFAHPNLEFICYREIHLETVDKTMERYRNEKIPIEKLKFVSRWYCYREIIPLIDKSLDIALKNGVKDLVLDLPNIKLYPLPIFKILATKSLRELVLEGCNLKHGSISSGVVNCDSLRKLSLSYICLDENMLQALLNSCPFIISFILEYCYGLERIELLNLQNIKSISIRTRRDKNQLVKIQAPTLEHLSYCGYSLEKLDVVECQNLKSLDISDVMICNGFLQNLISRSPNLVSLEYKGDQAPELTTTKKSSQLKHSKIILDFYKILNAAWFCKLRKFLLNFTSWSQVALDFYGCNEINMKDLQLHHGVATPQVDVLNVKFSWLNWECPMFVDALLWSCHPRRLNLHSASASLTCFINDRLMYLRNLSHSPSHESEPWHCQLKEVKAFDGKNEPLQLRSGELAIRTLTDWEEVYFLLDWRCS